MSYKWAHNCYSVTCTIYSTHLLG